MDRQRFPERKFLIRGQSQLDAVMAAARNVPFDSDRPIEVVIREQVRPRKLSQNALYWASTLRDIEEQGYRNGQQFIAKVWHFFFKEAFLPETFDEQLCLPHYCKWHITPRGERVLFGGTGDLTVKGFSNYLEQVTAFAVSELGVQFGERQ